MVKKLPADDDQMMFLRDTGIAAWRQIADRLEAEINGGVFPPGAQLPTEMALAKRFGVNRHTVRRAINLLVSHGRLRSTQGVGTFVELRPISYSIGSRTRFSEIVSRDGRDPGGESFDAEEISASDIVAAKLKLEPGVPVLRMFSIRSANGVPLSFSTGHYPLPRLKGIDVLVNGGDSFTTAFSKLGIANYSRAETHVSGRLVEAAETQRLQISPGRVVLVADYVSVDENNIPIHATTTVFPADRVELVLKS